MGTGSLRLGRISGIAVNVHWSVGFIAVFLGASLGSEIGWIAGAIGVFAFLGSILAHEFAHALTARRFGVGTESVQLWALGGVARLDSESPTPKAEGWIAAAGPIASIGLGLVGLGTWFFLDGQHSSNQYLALIGWLGLINAFLAVFNLLPGAPLDGGRILRAVRWQIHGNRHRASREAGRAGMFVGWAITAVGFALLLQGQSGVWLIITGAFIAVNAKVEIAAATVSERLDGIKVRDLTWFGVASAGFDMDADSMLWQRRRLGAAGGVAVTDDDGAPQGLVLEDQLWAIPADERPWVMLTQMMVPFDRVARAEPDDDLSSVLPRLDLASPVVAVWQNDKLVGLVPPRLMKERLTSVGL
jgi:Zn-dependent protease